MRLEPTLSDSLDPVHCLPLEERLLQEDMPTQRHTPLGWSTCDTLCSAEPLHSDRLPTMPPTSHPSFWQKILPRWLYNYFVSSPDTYAPAVHASPPPSPPMNDSLQELDELLHQLEEQTLHDILRVILLRQIDLEKEIACAAGQTVTSHQDMQRKHDVLLEEVGQLLRRDQKVHRHLQTAQQITTAATLICGVAGAIVGGGLLSRIGLLIWRWAGAATGGAVLAGISLTAGVGAIVACVSNGFTHGLKAYYKRGVNHDLARQESIHHIRQAEEREIERANQRLMAIAETDQAFKERLFRLLAEFQQLIQLILKSN